VKRRIFLWKQAITVPDLAVRVFASEEGGPDSTRAKLTATAEQKSFSELRRASRAKSVDASAAGRFHIVTTTNRRSIGCGCEAWRQTSSCLDPRQRLGDRWSNREVEFIEASPFTNRNNNGVQGRITSNSGGSAIGEIEAFCLK
jgi:hypothetical protein